MLFITMRHLLSILIFIVIFTSHCFAQFNDPKEIIPLKIDSLHPDSKVVRILGSSSTLKELTEMKPAVFIFFRGGWCPYCNIHLGELQKIESSLKEIGFKIIAISPDKAENLKKSISKLNLTYELVSDPGLNAAIDFGIAYRVADDDFKNYLSYGVDLEEASGEKHRLLPVPAAFLVDSKGRIRFAYANYDYTIRVSGPKVLEEAKKIILSEKNN